MPRARTGSFWYDPKTGDLYGRVTWTDFRGKNHDKKRKSISGTRREARQHIKDLLEDIDEQGEKTVDGSALTIKQLAEHYKTHQAIPAEYDKKGIKKAGMRSYRDARRKADALVAFFGPKTLVRSVSYGDLALFKATRLRTPAVREHNVFIVVDGKKIKTKEKREHPRAIASVHRELEVLRRMLRIAIQHRWLKRNPFLEGEPLIKTAEETMRERIALKTEEAALLEACNEDDRRKHLRPFLICAFDTGFRPIEMVSLKVSDIDFADNAITAVSYKGKRRRERQFEMTKRLRREMELLCKDKKPDALVFGFASVKRSFATAKRLAGLEGVSLDDFRVYDARHTATTRLIRRGMGLEEAGKLMGHTQPKTTWRYMHADKSTRRRAATLLEQDDDD
jgi:integrase